MATYKGRFQPKNPQKYKGDPTKIIYRSSWELRFMKYLDENANIIQWASEELHIPYKSPLDGKWHRYFPDFYVEARSPDGSVKKMLLEVKPAAQTKPPTTPKRRTKRYISEVMTYGVNEAKWKAAKEFCDEKGWEFRIITEAELFKKPTK